MDFEKKGNKLFLQKAVVGNNIILRSSLQWKCEFIINFTLVVH